ncbi:MAG: hypothetical protein Q7J46_08750, partial [Pseudomonas sp.]|nr:hypothetical protein [Pseudomonas sp.]
MSGRLLSVMTGNKRPKADLRGQYQNEPINLSPGLLALEKGTDLLSSLPATTGFALTASHFLFARAKEKVTKEKARPASGFRYAQ